MSQYQSKGDRSEVGLRKTGKSGSGAAYTRAGGSIPAAKGGGAGGLGPSASAPPGPLNPSSSSALQASNAPASNFGSNRGGKRPNGATGQSKGAPSGGPSDPYFNHKGQHNFSQHQMQPHPQPQPQPQPYPVAGSYVAKQVPTVLPSSNGSTPSSSRPGTPSGTSAAGATEPASPVPAGAASGEAARGASHPPFSFQFGTISPAFMHSTGMQIPARTSSAPPNLDEQKRDQARFEVRFEAGTAAPAKAPTVSSGQQQQQQQRQGLASVRQVSNSVEQPVQTNRMSMGPALGLPSPQPQQSMVTATVAPPHSQPSQGHFHGPYLHRQVPVSSQAHLIQAQLGAQAQVAMVQQPIPQQTLQSQQGMMQQSSGQGMKFPQSMMPPSHAVQIIGTHLGSIPSQLPSQQVPSQIAHQLGSQLGGSLGNQIPAGMPGAPQYGPTPNQYIQPRTNKAVKIVHPETHEELKFDTNVKKGSDSFIDNSGPTMTTASGGLSSRVISNGPAQPRTPLGFGGGPHHQINMNYFTGLQPPYSHQSQPYYSSGPAKPAVPPAGSVTPTVRYGFSHPPSGQGIPLISNSGPQSIPSSSKVGSSDIMCAEPSVTGAVTVVDTASAAVQSQVISHIPPAIATNRPVPIVTQQTVVQADGKQQGNSGTGPVRQSNSSSGSQDNASTKSGASLKFGDVETSGSAPPTIDSSSGKSNKMSLGVARSADEPGGVHPVTASTVPGIEAPSSKAVNKASAVAPGTDTSGKPVVTGGQSKQPSFSVELVAANPEVHAAADKLPKVEPAKSSSTGTRDIPRKSTKKERPRQQQQAQSVTQLQSGAAQSMLAVLSDLQQEKKVDVSLPSMVAIAPQLAAEKVQEVHSTLPASISSSTTAVPASTSAGSNLQRSRPGMPYHGPAKTAAPANLDFAPDFAAEQCRKAGGKAFNHQSTQGLEASTSTLEENVQVLQGDAGTVNGENIPATAKAGCSNVSMQVFPLEQVTVLDDGLPHGDLIEAPECDVTSKDSTIASAGSPQLIPVEVTEAGIPTGQNICNNKVGMELDAVPDGNGHMKEPDLTARENKEVMESSGSSVCAENLVMEQVNSKLLCSGTTSAESKQAISVSLGDRVSEVVKSDESGSRVVTLGLKGTHESVDVSRDELTGESNTAGDIKCGSRGLDASLKLLDPGASSAPSGPSYDMTGESNTASSVRCDSLEVEDSLKLPDQDTPIADVAVEGGFTSQISCASNSQETECTLTQIGASSENSVTDRILSLGAQDMKSESDDQNVACSSLKEIDMLELPSTCSDNAGNNVISQGSACSSAPLSETGATGHCHVDEAFSSPVTDDLGIVDDFEDKVSSNHVANSGHSEVSAVDNPGHSEEEQTGNGNPGTSKGTGANLGHQIDPSVTVAPEVKRSSKSSKKKLKDLLAKADAAGTTADLYNAYKPPEEKKHDEVKVADVSRLTASSNDVKKSCVTSVEEPEPGELDDWEDAAELPSPKVTTSHAGPSAVSSAGSNEISGSGSGDRKKYTRYFILTYKEQNRELPSNFEIRADIAELLLNPQAAMSQLADRDALPNSGRVLDRQLSSGPRLERRGIVADDDKWTRQPSLTPFPGRGDLRIDTGFPGGYRPALVLNPGLIPRMSPGYRPGVPMPPLMSFPGTPLMSPVMPVGPGLVKSNTADSDRWQRAPAAQKGLIPSPQTPLPAIHKAEKRYEVGTASDEEEVKQRQIKGILNKLTPQNFDKLFEKVKEVNITSALTLTGVISQIFDKALTEPTFTELYTKFCVHLAVELPEFNEDGMKVTFKRVLLNKSQEEFERGVREQAEADKVEEDGEVRLTPEEREEKRVKAKRRMLGNIRFIGELFKNSMLTERIMHECILKLLADYQNPEEEDVEALCKLMSTIGRMIDHHKAKEHIDAYFERLTQMSNNAKLSSRLRFMLKDVIDLRKNDWQERRKVEGPKKIEEVHRDAVQERQATVAQAGRLARNSSMSALSGRRLTSPSDFGMRGPPSPMFPPTSPMGNIPPMGGPRGAQAPQMGMRGSYGQDVRIEDRLLMDNRAMPMPLSQRSGDEVPITLGPQGGLGKGMAIRGQPLASGRSALAGIPPIVPADTRRYGMGTLPMVPERVPFGSREEIPQRTTAAERPLTPLERPLLERPFPPDRHGSGHPGRDMRTLERTLSDRPVSMSMTSNVSQQALPPPPLARPSSAPSAASTPLSEGQLRKKSEQTINEYYSARDLKEAAQCVEDLKSHRFHSTMLSLWISDSLEKKDMERQLLFQLMVYLNKTEPCLLKQDQILKSFETILLSLEDTIIDVPKAPDYLGGLLGKLIVAGVLSLPQVGRLIKEGLMEPGGLLQTGFGLKIFVIILDSIRNDKGESALMDLYRSSGLHFKDFASPEDTDMEEILMEFRLQCLCPMMFVEKQIHEFFIKEEPISEILRWLERNILSTSYSDAAFLMMIMTQVLRQCVPTAPVDYEKHEIQLLLLEKLRKYAPVLKHCAPGKIRAALVNQRQYIAAVQLFANEHGHPPGLMTTLFKSFYADEVISETAYLQWQDDVDDSTPGRNRALREVHQWLSWLQTAPEEAGDDED